MEKTGRKFKYDHAIWEYPEPTKRALKDRAKYQEELKRRKIPPKPKYTPPSIDEIIKGKSASSSNECPSNGEWDDREEYEGWFWLYGPSYVRWWGLKVSGGNCVDSGCQETKLPCDTWGDIHQEHAAWDDTKQKYVSVMFNVKCNVVYPCCYDEEGKYICYHLGNDYSDIPSSDYTGWIRLSVHYYPYKKDCITQAYVGVCGQAVVVGGTW